MNVLPDELLWLDLYDHVVIRNPDFDDDQLHVIMNVLGMAWFWGEDYMVADLNEGYPYITNLALLGDIFLEEQAVDG